MHEQSIGIEATNGGYRVSTFNLVTHPEYPQTKLLIDSTWAIRPGIVF